MSPFGRSSWVPGVPPVPVKLDETVLSAFIVSAQEPVPEQSPLQPAKVEPEAALALRVTAVPSAYVSVQSPGQLMPVPVIVPEPVPVGGVTVRVRGGGLEPPVVDSSK